MHFPAKQPCTNDTVCNAACSRAEQSRAEQSRAEQNRTEQNRTEQNRIEWIENHLLYFTQIERCVFRRGSNVVEYYRLTWHCTLSFCQGTHPDGPLKNCLNLSLTSKALWWAIPPWFGSFVRLLRTFPELPMSLRPSIDLSEIYENTCHKNNILKQIIELVLGHSKILIKLHFVISSLFVHSLVFDFWFSASETLVNPHTLLLTTQSNIFLLFI
jgi:hypothetical protein